jgi:integrase
MAERKRLTDKLIERLTAPPSGRRDLADELLPALALRITERGTKTWSVVCRTAGQGGETADGRPLAGSTMRITLGRWPVLSVSDARARARDVLQKAGEGRDPRAERRDAFARRRETAIERIAEKFLAEEKQRIPSWRNGEACLRLHVLPKWSGRPIGEISRLDVNELLKAMVADGKRGAAREVRKTLSKLYGYALDNDLAARSPVDRLRRDDLKPNKAAGRALSDRELRAVWRAAVGMKYPFGDVHRLLLLTGCRLSEIAKAIWPEVDLAERTLLVSAQRHKSRRHRPPDWPGQRVPLNEASWVIVSALPRFRRGPYLFSCTHGRAPISGFTRAADQLRAEAAVLLESETGEKLLHFRAAHDLRVTVRSRLTELRVPFDVSEAVLEHSRVGLAQTYDKSTLEREKRQALDLWAKTLMAIVDG